MPTHSLLAALALTPILALQPADQTSDQPGPPKDWGEIKITHNYSNDLNAEALATPEADRAWPRYRDALMALSKLPDDLRFAELNWPAHPGEPGWKEAVAHIEANQPALELMRKAAAMPHLGYIATDVPDQILERHRAALDGRDYEAQEPNENPMVLTLVLSVLPDVRQMVRHLEQDLYLAVTEGNADRAMADLRAMRGLAHHASQLPFLMSQLFALAIDSSTQRDVRWLLHELPDLLSLEQMRIVRDEVLAADHVAMMLRGLSDERTMFVDVVQRIFTDNGQGDGVLSNRALLSSITYPPDVGGALGEVVLATVAATRKQHLQEYDRHLHWIRELLDHPTPWLAESRPFSNERDGWVQRLLSYRIRYPVLLQLLAPYERAADSAFQTRFEQSATRVAVALEIYRRKHAQYPKSLNDLVPDFLDAIPADLFDGEPIRYKLTDAKPIIYSIGADRDDDGGRPPEPPETSPHDWINPVKFENSQAPDYDGPQPPDGDWILYPPQP